MFIPFPAAAVSMGWVIRAEKQTHIRATKRIKWLFVGHFLLKTVSLAKEEMIGNGDDKNFLLEKAEEISREKTELLSLVLYSMYM